MPKDHSCAWKLGHLMSASETLSMHNQLCHVCDCDLFHAAAQLLVFRSLGPSLVPSTFSPFSCILVVSVTRFCYLPGLASNACSSCLSLPIHGTAGVHYPTHIIGFIFQIRMPVKAVGRFPTQVYLWFLLSALLVT